MKPPHFLECPCGTTIASKQSDLTIECHCGAIFGRVGPLEPWTLTTPAPQSHFVLGERSGADVPRPHEFTAILDSVERWTSVIALGVEASDAVRIDAGLRGLANLVRSLRDRSPATPSPKVDGPSERFWQRAFMAALARGSSPKYAQVAADESLRIYEARKERNR